MKTEIILGTRDEWYEAVKLARDVFKLCVEEDCTEAQKRNFLEGVESIYLFNQYLDGRYKLYLAYQGKFLVGMMTIMKDSHISLLFVKKHCQKMGIGRELVDKCVEHAQGFGKKRITVNAAPISMGFYIRYGFDYDLKTIKQDDAYARPMYYQIKNGDL